MIFFHRPALGMHRELIEFFLLISNQHIFKLNYQNTKKICWMSFLRVWSEVWRSAQSSWFVYSGLTQINNAWVQKIMCEKNNISNYENTVKKEKNIVEEKMTNCQNAFKMSISHMKTRFIWTQTTTNSTKVDCKLFRKSSN